jgi:hypothetical protein
MMRLAGLLICVISAVAQNGTVNADSLVVKDFTDRVAAYVKLHNSAQAAVHRPKPTNSPEAIKEYEQGLAEQICALRKDAVQGAIFTPQIADQFRRLIGITMKGAGAVRIRESLKRAAPVPGFTLRVNSVYPAELPLQSTPPTLLLNLPTLPKEVEYRVVGHDLLLRDVDANLIVDFITNAIS